MAATYLFEHGKSHPQVVEILAKQVVDEPLVTAIVDKAMNNEWDKLSMEIMERLGKGENFESVVQFAKTKETDPEIAMLLADSWYDLKIAYADNLLEGSENTSVALQWLLISPAGLLLVFILNWPLRWKIILGLLTILSIALYFIGRSQKRKAGEIERFFRTDITNR